MYPGVHAQSTPDTPAVIMGGTGQAITYRELNDGSNRFAQLLRDSGVRPGDHIAFMLENHPRFFDVAWGAQRAGLFYTALSSRLTAEEAAYIINDCEAQVFVASAHTRPVAEALVGATPTVKLRLMLDDVAPGYEPYEAVTARYPADPVADEREGADMLYSSGTTGRPKGVKPPLPSGEMGSGAGLATLLRLLFDFRPDMVYLSPAPLYHAAPLRFSMATHRHGGTVVVMDRFDPADALRLIEAHGVTHSQWVPTMFIRLLKLPPAERARYELSSLECAIHAAAPCPIPIKEQLIEWWGPIVHEYYAGTEGQGFVYCNSQDWLAHKGTVGKALVGTVHILDEDGTELGPRDVGTVYFESPFEFEYHHDPEKTKSAHDPKGRGWTTLGDVGYLDDDGFLYLTDRKAYMIISGGVNIYPQEIENLLAVHPKVADAAVFGVPNEEFGEEVKAVIQPLEWADAGPDLERELLDHCRQHLSPVKCPRSIDFEEELPRHPTGKLYKRLLRDRYWGDRPSRIV